ncbi:hypothetical protein [Feifania hominis]|uniref:Zn-finger containing protein n=1 Tax=Feifania hominis TaxID=2763660 RepID=A0A926DDM3_9FIRM|nr:hypothetical protein [Feifania hominis]MBC8535917.1 hypothetical protein [Feifania hominis]
MRNRLLQFMAGRCGPDGFNQFLSIAALICLVINLFTGSVTLYVIALALLVYSLYRMFSRNLARRYQENMAYYRLRNRITGWFKGFAERFRQRRTHRFYRCPSCRCRVRVPKGVGKIAITCPSCHREFIKKA